MNVTPVFAEKNALFPMNEYFFIDGNILLSAPLGQTCTPAPEELASRRPCILLLWLSLLYISGNAFKDVAICKNGLQLIDFIWR